MEAIYLLLPLALIVSALAVGAFLWALRRGQFEDLSSPAYRMLEEDRHGSVTGPARRAPKGRS